MANYFEIQNGVINNIYDMDNPQPNFNHHTAYVEGITWVECSGEYKAGDLYNGTDLSYGDKSILEAREWRNTELKETDSIVPITDHPNRTATMAYRQELRDWPSTSAFPSTKPTI